jgi:HAD superfamily hydrolase (TIGR01509 family)
MLKILFTIGNIAIIVQGLVPLRQIKGLFLDCDGTICETEAPITLRQFNQAFEILHQTESTIPLIQWNVDEYAALLETGDSVQRYLSYFEQTDIWPLSVRNGFKTKIQFAKEMQQLKNEQFDSVFDHALSTGEIKLRPGVEALVRDALSSGVPVAVCSNSNTAPVRAIVEKLLSFGKDKVPVYGGDSSPRKKPHPDMYLVAAANFGILESDLGNCVVIEDSYMGLTAVKAANMYCVITKSRFSVDENFSAADVVVDDLVAGGITLAVLHERMLPDTTTLKERQMTSLQYE